MPFVGLSYCGYTLNIFDSPVLDISLIESSSTTLGMPASDQLLQIWPDSHGRQTAGDGSRVHYAIGRAVTSITHNVVLHLMCGVPTASLFNLM
jgi:hypothetical protein